MASREDINEQFDEMGIELSNDVLDKCVEISLTYNINANELLETWMAFSCSKLNGAEPTVEFLSDMERKEFIEKKCFAKSNRSSIKNVFASPQNIKITSEAEEIDDIMESYVYNTPKSKRKLDASAKQSIGSLNPVSYSPVTGTPRNETGTSQKVIYTYGNPALIKSATWSAEKFQKIEIKNILRYENECLNQKSKYMFDNLTEKCLIFADHLFDIGKDLCKKYFGENTFDYDITHVDIPNQNEIKAIGRIYCDSENKLDPVSTLIIGSDEMKCRTAILNFNNTKKPFGIFPGQIIMVSGINPTGDTIFVNEILCERNLKSMELPKITENLNLVIACGPYTTENDQSYDVINDLVVYCKNNKPDVLILIGPFIDASRYLIKENNFTEDFEMLLKKILNDIFNAVGNEIIICIVSSQQDLVGIPVYPTRPYNIEKNFDNVYMLPDPCIIDINGLTVGLTSTDIFEHLVNGELSIGAGDKVKRIVNYLFQQGSFYPLHPPSLDVCVDDDLAKKFAKLDFIPNILVLPSNQKYFIRDVRGCLAINPGRLNDKNDGAFVRILVKPPESETNISNFIACQILKI